MKDFFIALIGIMSILVVLVIYFTGLGILMFGIWLMNPFYEYWKKRDHGYR